MSPNIVRYGLASMGPGSIIPELVQPLPVICASGVIDRAEVIDENSIGSPKNGTTFLPIVICNKLVLSLKHSEIPKTFPPLLQMGYIYPKASFPIRPKRSRK